MLIAQVDFIQSISIPCNLCFIVIQRRAVLVDNGGDALVAGYDAFNGIRAFDGLYFCDCFQLRKNLRIFIFTHARHRFQSGNVGSKVYKVCRKQTVVQKRVIKFSHTAPAFLHMIIVFYMQKSKKLFHLSAYIF